MSTEKERCGFWTETDEFGRQHLCFYSHDKGEMTNFYLGVCPLKNYKLEDGDWKVLDQHARRDLLKWIAADPYIVEARAARDRD